jgi:hypothetical protein
MSKNENKTALKHGAFCEAIILPGEDTQEFQQLLASLKDEWSPEGPTENDKIESIAMGMWRKRRFRRYIRKWLAIDSAGERRMQRDSDTLLSIGKDIDSGVPGLVTEEYLSDKLDRRWFAVFKQTHPRKKYDSDAAWLKDIAASIDAIVDKYDSASAKLPTIDEELSDEKFAFREQAFEERIDAKIDKDLKLLGQIKTMKAIGIGQRRAPVTIEPLKQIDSPAIQAAESEKCNARLCFLQNDERGGHINQEAISLACGIRRDRRLRRAMGQRAPATPRSGGRSVVASKRDRRDSRSCATKAQASS